MVLRRRISSASLALAASLAAALLSQSAATSAAGASAAPLLRVVLDGQAVHLSPPPILVDGVPYISAAALADLLGMPARWDPRSRTLAIGPAPGSAHSFLFQGVRYAVTGLQARTYTGPQNTSGLYWIVDYTLTNTTSMAVDVPATQPSLVLLGPHGAQYEPDATLSGATAGTLNPGITFSSYAVFNVPAGANPAAYALGFDAYRATAKGFQPAPLGAALPPSSARTTTTRVGATYTVSNLWDSDAQEVLVRQVLVSTAILPDLTPASFDPTTSFWIVDLAVNNPGSQAITLQPSQFALQFGSGASLPPYPVAYLPGYVPASNLFSLTGGASAAAGGASGGASGGSAPSPGSVSVPPGQVWSGALLFEVPGTVSTTSPSLAISVNGQTRVLSVAPCPGGVCPPVGQ